MDVLDLDYNDFTDKSRVSLKELELELRKNIAQFRVRSSNPGVDEKDRQAAFMLLKKHKKQLARLFTAVNSKQEKINNQKLGANT